MPRRRFSWRSGGASHACRGAGKIINIADVAGEMIWPGYFPYSVSKAALHCGEPWSGEVVRSADSGQRDFSGPVLFPENYTDEQKRLGRRADAVETPGSPQDIVNAAMFLIENDYITGEVIHVDGGRHIL